MTRGSTKTSEMLGLKKKEKGDNFVWEDSSGAFEFMIISPPSPECCRDTVPQVAWGCLLRGNWNVLAALLARGSHACTQDTGSEQFILVPSTSRYTFLIWFVKP